MTRPPRFGWSGFLLGALLAGMYAPTIVWMVDRWFAPGSYWAHGILVPPVAILWAGARLRAARPIEDSPSGLGLPVLTIGLLLQVASALLGVHFTSALSALVVGAGLILRLRGPRTLGVVGSPLVFLVFMIPMPLVVVAHLTLRMKLFSAAAGAAVGRALGIDVVQDGSFLVLGSQRLLVGDACSGLRSLIALLALGFLIVHRYPWQAIGKGIALAAVVPLAMLGNVLRVVLLAWAGERLGVERVGGALHFLTGLLVYLVSLAGLMGGGALWSRRRRREGMRS
jgi:exosortase